MSAQPPLMDVWQASPGASPAPLVLVVDQAGLADHVLRCAGQAGYRAVTAPSYLAAMGAIAHHDDVQGVVGPLSVLAGRMESAVKALRQLAPYARLIAVDDRGQPDAVEHALRAGFDCCLPRSFDQLAWNAALPPAPNHAPVPSPQASPPPEIPEVPGISESLESSQMSSFDASGAALGDTDLVAAILHARVALRDQAMRIIHAQPGMADVGWADDLTAIPDGHARSAVTYLDAAYGHLHGSGAQDQLVPWAHWLAHWLAMDDQFHRLKQLAMRDELTGAWNRRYFRRFLTRILEHARSDRSQVTLLVFDIDDFKTYNDKYGHAAGDQILSETARLMQSVVREHDVVARIGGDEFAVIFWDAQAPRRADTPQPGQHPHTVLSAAKRFQQAICQHRFPKLLDETPGTLTISGGLASYPWDGATPDDLLHRADAMAIQSKRQGKNAITLGPGAKRSCDPDAPPST